MLQLNTSSIRDRKAWTRLLSYAIEFDAVEGSLDYLHKPAGEVVYGRQNEPLQSKKNFQRRENYNRSDRDRNYSSRREYIYDMNNYGILL